MSESKSNRGLVVALIIFILISISLAGCIVYDKVIDKKDTNEVEKKESKKEEKENIKKYNSKSIEEQMEELKKVFNSSDNNFKEISRSEANKLIDNEIPEDVDFGCGPVYKFYAYDDYIFITNEDMCFHNTTVMIYTHNHKIDEINNVYQEVYSPEFGKESESLIDTHIVVKDGYLYFISGFHLDIPGPLVLCKYNLKHDQDYGEVVDIYDLEHLSQ